MSKSFKHINKPIYKRLLYSYLIATLPVSLIIILIVYLIAIPSAKEKNTQELRNTTKIITGMIYNSATVAIKNHLKSIANKNKEIISHYYDLYKSGSISYSEFNDKVYNYLLTQKVGVSGYPYVLNSKGILEVHPYKELVGKNVSEYAFVRKQMQEKEGYLEYDWKNPGEKKERPKALYMTYFEPLDWIISVSSYREEFNDLLNIDDFREMVLSLKVIKTGYVYILDSTGKALIHPFMPKYYDIFAETGRENGFVKYMISNKTGFVEYEWQNPNEPKPYKKIAFFERVPVFNWVVVASGYYKDAYESIEIMRLSAYFTAIFIVIVGFILSNVFSKRLSGPIVSAVSQIQENLDKKVAKDIIISTEDEIQFLVDEINKYLKEIEQQKIEIINQQKKYTDLFETSPIGVLILDKCIITECNPACSNIFATERKQIINKDITDYFNLQDKRKEELLDIFTKYLKISVEKKLVSSFEWEFVSNDGNKVIVFVQAKLFSEGESPQFVLFLVDITNEKKYQQELIELNANLERKVEERTEELNKALKYLEDANYELKSLNEQMAEESRKLAELNEKLIRSEEELIKTNAAKDKFISILAHDLRNPIAGIRLLLDTIHQILQSKEIANEATIEMLKKQVQLARSATNQTFELLENLLQWANLQRKGFDYSPELNNIFFFVDKCINIVKPNADNKGIKIVNEVNPNARGYFDEFVIQTIIRNLLMNAIKFSYEGSEIKVTLKDCEISDNCYTLSIQDRGVGMSEETIASIMNNGITSSSAGTKGEKGSGLGLLLCKEYIEKMGGRFFIESKLNAGTTISFTILKNVTF